MQAFKRELLARGQAWESTVADLFDYRTDKFEYVGIYQRQPAACRRDMTMWCLALAASFRLVGDKVQARQLVAYAREARRSTLLPL